MTNGNLPPQAFTAQDVGKAIKWLEEQPTHIRALAKSKESLMSLYKQAMVYKDEFYSRYPEVNEERFRKDLNDIASQLNSFGPSTNSEAPKKEGGSSPQRSSQISPLSYQEDSDSKFIESQNSVQKTGSIAASEKKETTNKESLAAGSSLELDTLTETRIQEAQRRLNLSSPEEALRMLVSLGYEKFQKL